MDAPPIQYCRTEDGVNIAYWTTGEGPPLLWLPTSPWPWAVTQSQPESQAWFERIAQRWQLVQFDQRGIGLSRAPDVDHSLDAHLDDVDAVLAAVGLSQVSIWAGLFAGPLGITYAARNPERVNRLILWCSFAASDDFRDAPSAISARTAASGGDWTRLTQAVFTGALGWSYPDYARNAAAAAAEQTTQEEFAAAHRFRFHDDAKSLLQVVACPTLVMHRDHCVVPLELGRDLAADVPGAQLRVFAGDGLIPELGGADEVFDAMAEFLPSDSSSSGGDERPAGFRTLLFTDLESSTALTQAVGDAKAQEILHGHNAAVRTALAAHDGDEVKHTGDGIFAAFGSAVSAVEAALQIQRDLAGGEVRVRVGLNAGEPIAEDDDLFGTAVQLAARICDRADPGQVLVSHVVRELCAGRTFVFADQGEATLKGFPEPVRLFVVGEGE